MKKFSSTRKEYLARFESSGMPVVDEEAVHVGRHFGWFVVVGKSNKTNASGRTLWAVMCACGREELRTLAYLKRIRRKPAMEGEPRSGQRGCDRCRRYWRVSHNAREIYKSHVKVVMRRRGFKNIDSRTVAVVQRILRLKRTIQKIKGELNGIAD